MKAAIKILVIIWVIYIIQEVFNLDFIHFFGICPRDTKHWIGIFTAGFIHANIAHITANSLAIFLLTWILFVFYKRIATIVWILILITDGALIWLLARGQTCHIGISGEIFGLIGFILTSGILRGSFKAFIAALIVAVLYGGVIWSGILPTSPYISWEGHLFGFIAGILYAYLFRNKAEKQSEIEAEKLQNKLPE